MKAVEQVLQRHRGFWRMEAVGEPILRVRPHEPLGPGGQSGRYTSSLEEGELIDPRTLALDEVLAAQPAELLDGSFFNGIALPGLCWTEALFGCPVRMERGGAWAERFLPDRARIAERCLRGGPRHDDPWLATFRRGTALLAAHAGGRFPVTQPLMRGPLDIMASALGHEAMATAFHDDPDLAAAVLALCTDTFVSVAEEHLAIAPPFLGGDVTFGLWAPGRAIRTQLDNAVLLSPALYRDRFLAFDSRVFRSFDFVVIHVHSGCLHIVDALLSAPELSAIQVSIDFPGGPLLGAILPQLKRIQGRKPLIVTGPATDREIERALSLLPPAGVALDLQRVVS